MAMQAGMGFSKIIILVGAGYTGTLMMKKGKLSDVLGELQVTDVHNDLSQIGYDLDSLNGMVSGLNGKIMTLEEKLDLTNLGVWYLCNKADGTKISGKAQEQFRLAGKSVAGYLTSGGSLSLEGVKVIADNIDPIDGNKSPTNGLSKDGSFG